MVSTEARNREVSSTSIKSGIDCPHDLLLIDFCQRPNTLAYSIINQQQHPVTMKFTLPTLVAMIAASPMLAAQPVERDDTYVELAAPVVVTLVTHWDKGKVAAVDLSEPNDDKVQVDDVEWRRVRDYRFEDATQQKFFGVEREGPEGPHITVSLCPSYPNWG
jgi:negative regulator of sigma E activity